MMKTLKKFGTDSRWVVLTITSIVLLLVFFRNFVYPYSGRELPIPGADGQEYLLLAQGHTEAVPAPFPKRFLHPFLVRCLCLSTGLSFRSGFIVWDVAAFILLVHCLVKIIADLGLSPWTAISFLLTPFMIDQLELGYLPDLFEAALMTLFFLLIQRDKFQWALLVLALCFMTREDTAALCLVVAILTWRRSLYSLVMGTIGVAFFGMIFGAWCARSGQPNIHGLPDFLYLLLKFPHQFLKNVLGLVIWTNTWSFGQPFVKFMLPSFLQWGNEREVGICYPEWNLPLFTLITLLSLFGSGPLLIWMNWRMRLWTKDHPLMVQMAFIYGGMAFLLGTSMGDWIDRLIGHGWPLFWIVIPYILAKMQGPDALEKTAVSLFVIAWIPSILNYSRYSSFWLALLTLAAILVAYALTFRQLACERAK